MGEQEGQKEGERERIMMKEGESRRQMRQRSKGRKETRESAHDRRQSISIQTGRKRREEEYLLHLSVCTLSGVWAKREIMK